jgi:hypothetical protein
LAQTLFENWAYDVIFEEHKFEEEDIVAALNGKFEAFVDYKNITRLILRLKPLINLSIKLSGGR